MYTTCICHPRLGRPWLNLAEIFGIRKLDDWAIIRHYLRDPKFSCFHTILGCDRQTHTHTQTHDDGIYFTSIASNSDNTYQQPSRVASAQTQAQVTTTKWLHATKKAKVCLLPKILSDKAIQQNAAWTWTKYWWTSKWMQMKVLLICYVMRLFPFRRRTFGLDSSSSASFSSSAAMSPRSPFSTSSALITS